MLTKSPIALTMLLCACTAIAAEPLPETELGVGLNTKDVKVALNHSLNEDRSLALNGGYFYREKDATHLAGVGIYAQGNLFADNENGSGRLGIRAAYFDARVGSGTALALGGQVKLNMPYIVGLSGEIDVHYSPTIIHSSSQVDAMWLTSVALNYRLLGNAELFVAYDYNLLSVKESESMAISSTVLAGIKVSF